MSFKKYFLKLFSKSKKVSPENEVADLLNLPKMFDDLEKGDLIRYKGPAYDNVFLTFGNYYKIEFKSELGFFEGPTFSVKNDKGIIEHVPFYDFVILLDPKYKDLIPENKKIPHIYIRHNGLITPDDTL